MLEIKYHYPPRWKEVKAKEVNLPTQIISKQQSQDLRSESLVPESVSPNIISAPM